MYTKDDKVTLKALFNNDSGCSHFKKKSEAAMALHVISVFDKV